MSNTAIRKGRPRGALNRSTRAIREASAKLLSDRGYVASLKKRLKSGKAPHMEVLLHHYAYGKPKETVKVEDAPVAVAVMVLRTRDDFKKVLGAPDLEANALPDGDDDYPRLD